MFLGKGCPDMRKGVVKVMAKVMSVKAAARLHRIPLKRLLEDLNAAVKATTASASAPGGQGSKDRDEDSVHPQRSAIRNGARL